MLTKIGKLKKIRIRLRPRVLPFAALLFALFLTSCSEIKTPKPEPLISKTDPPLKQEFRWSNGKLPKSFDPARASAAPETDIVRALYEGLTDLDPKTLEPVPSLAVKWTASKDKKVWKFYLRQDAKWTNGENVTAKDFVDSWRRLTELGNKVAQRNLLKNIVGMDSEDVLPVFADEPKENDFDEFSGSAKLKLSRNSNLMSENNSLKSDLPKEKRELKESDRKENESLKFGVEEIDKFTLRVTLIHPDNEFPKLVAHPIFHPVYGSGREFEKEELSTDITTNGAFRLVSVQKDAITLERSDVFLGQGGG